MLKNYIRRCWAFISRILLKNNKANEEQPEGQAVIMPILNNPGKYVFYCPGCEANHMINTDQASSPCHTLTGTLIKPTIRASVMCRSSDNKTLCHSFVTNGKIEFLKDCTHHLAGTTVDLLPY